MTAFEIVPFNNTNLEALREGEDVWVSLVRMCEALDIAPQRQQRKLAAKPWAVTALKAATGPDGKRYDVVCLHLDAVPMWLAGIEPSRVKPAARPALELFQKECARVLRDHFFPQRAGSGGVAGSGGMGGGGHVNPAHFSMALRGLADVIDRQQQMSAQVLAIELTQQRLEQRLNAVERDPPTAERLSIRLGKKRKTWAIRDFRVAVEVAEAELGFKMTSTRACLAMAAGLVKLDGGKR